MSLHLSRRRLILAALVACGLQTAVLATMITSNAGILADGEAIRLKTVPVDPRDLLRGEYVILNYEFTALDSSLIADPFPTEAGTAILHVRLAPGGDGFWHPVNASFSDLPREEGTVVLRSLPFQYQPLPEKPAVVRAEYGLERYYVPEGQGKALEEARNNRQIAVDVRVAEDGAARIAALEVLDATQQAAPAASSDAASGRSKARKDHHTGVIFPLRGLKRVI